MEEDEQSSAMIIAKGASNETTELGSAGGGSSVGGSVEGHNHGGGNNAKNPAADASRQVVAGLFWTDDEGYAGTYTGEVNEDNVPDGLGLIRYDAGAEQEGEWRDGTLIRKKGASPSNINSLSTIEEEKSHKTPSIKYTDEFANFLAAKQIGIGLEGEDDDDDEDTTHMQRRASQSSNSMAANTTGENSHARDFENDMELYSSTSTRTSHNLYYASDNNSRKGHLYSSSNSRHSSSDYGSSRRGHLYSSTNSRHSSDNNSQQRKGHYLFSSTNSSRPEQYRSSITKRSPGESTTHEGSDSDSDRNSISSGENYIDYSDSIRNSQLKENHPQEDLGLVAEEKEGEIDSDRSSSHKSSRGRSSSSDYTDNIRNACVKNSNIDDIRNTKDNSRNTDDYRPTERPVPHETIDAIQKLMANDSNVQYDSDDSSDDDQDSESGRTSAVFDWHKDRRRSVESVFPGIVEDSDDENKPSMSTRIKDDDEDDEDDERPRNRRFSSFREYGRLRSRWWCLLFSTCSIISIVGIAMISWAMVRMRKNKTSTNNNTSVPKPQSNQDAGTKLSLSWEKDVQCAPITIDITTDQFGNETTWALYKVKEVNEETNAFQATRTRLRPATSSDSNRKMEETTNNGSQLIRSGGPYSYIDYMGANNYTSPVYTSPVCLAEGNYNFVMSDVNGICCESGLGQYSIYFNGGRSIRDSPGVFMTEEITPFVVTSDDVLAALTTANSSQSWSPSTSISLSPSLSSSVSVEEFA